jgi:ketosteroid isomerase-like protein
MKQIYTLVFFFIFATSMFSQTVNFESELNALISSEKNFCKVSVQNGIREAFLEYLSDDAVIFRPRAVNGKKIYKEAPQPPSQATLIWEPKFADISITEDLGYTTGPWEYKSKTSEGEVVKRGYYVTIWKKQEDKKWKVVLDIGISGIQSPDNNFHFSSRGQKILANYVSKIDVESEEINLINLENEFSKVSSTKGTVEAFLSYVSDDVMFFRMNTNPLIGRSSIYTLTKENSETIIMQPEKSEVSLGGDLGYTYGVLTLKNINSKDEITEYSYTRIWSRQIDGKWKIVLDIAIPIQKN